MRRVVSWTGTRPDDEGFTLVELIVAMFVIAIILTSLAMVQTRAMVTIAQAKERQQATALANQTLEQLRALPWDTLKKGPVSYTHLRAHETRHDLVCRLLLEKKKNNTKA